MNKKQQVRKKRKVRRCDIPAWLRRGGRRPIHELAGYVGIIQFVEDQQKRTGWSINKICRHGVFYYLMSGSPASCPNGPSSASILHVICGATLRRLYFEGMALLRELSDTRDDADPSRLNPCGWIDSGAWRQAWLWRRDLLVDFCLQFAKTHAGPSTSR